MRKPEDNIGSVGDTMRVDGVLWHRSSNGRWGFVWTEKQINKLKRLYVDERMTLRETADTFGLSHSVIQNAVNAQGFMRSHYGRKAADQNYINMNKKLIAKTFKSGFSIPEIATCLNLPRELLSESLISLGLIVECRFARKAVIAKNRHRHESIKDIESWNSHLAKTEFKNYREYLLCVRILTRNFLGLFKKRFPDLVHDQKHKDHMYSIAAGFFDKQGVRRLRPIAPWIIAHPCNLQLLTRLDNARKGTDCHLTLKELKNKIEAFSEDTGLHLDKPLKTRKASMKALMKELGLKANDVSN